MSDLLLQKRKIVTIRKKKMKEENYRDERQLGKNSHQNSQCRGWKEQHLAHVMMLLDKWLEDTPRVGVHFQSTPWSISRDSTCRRERVRPPSVEELENQEFK